MTRPQVGERWRVTLEGRYEPHCSDPDCEQGYLRGEIPGQTYPVHWAYGTWERLLDPEPEWEVGAIVIDADGLALQYMTRNGRPAWRTFNSNILADAEVPRPLTRLVPEVKP